MPRSSYIVRIDADKNWYLAHRATWHTSPCSLYGCTAAGAQNTCSDAHGWPRRARLALATTAHRTVLAEPAARAALREGHWRRVPTRRAQQIAWMDNNRHLGPPAVGQTSIP